MIIHNYSPPKISSQLLLEKLSAVPRSLGLDRPVPLAKGDRGSFKIIVEFPLIFNLYGFSLYSFAYGYFSGNFQHFVDAVGGGYYQTFRGQEFSCGGVEEDCSRRGKLFVAVPDAVCYGEKR